ncbi:hypothetical protein FRC10_009046 [Ceratobasidium sp. 414]|nr:hypothetical protein FRC10_009046 [Ceratobasidium sp. 414]
MTHVSVYNPLGNISPTIHSSGDFSQDNYSAALQQWRLIRGRLAATVKDYADACSSLISVCSQPAERHLNNSTLNRTLVSLGDELPSLVQYETQLLAARAKLSALRNQSASLSPISTLPPEILSRIFTQSSLSCVHGDSSHKNHQFLCPVVFASVSTSWRRTALVTGRLWSHIDLAPNSNPAYRLYKRAVIWLDRVNDAPLHIHIHERACAKDEDIAQLVKFLSPHMKRLCTLYIDTECHSLDLFESTLACWLEYGQPGSIKTLVLRRPNPIPLLASLGPQMIQRLPRERLDGFLQPLRALHLHNVCMGWSASTAHQGLVELQVESLADVAGPTVGQFVAVLRGCPRLRKLKLARMNFRHEETEDVPSVHLGHLEELNLLGANPSVLKLLLPTLEVGAAPLAMSVALGEQASAFEELRTFFDRTNVCTLYLDARQQDWVALLFTSLQHLRTLVVSNCALLHNAYTEPALQVTPQPPAICAQLRSLSFIGCDLGLEPLQNMLKAHAALDILGLWRCKLKTSDAELNKHANLVEIVRPILTRLVPNVTHSNCPRDYPMLGWSVSDEHAASSVAIPSIMICAIPGTAHLVAPAFSHLTSLGFSTPQHLKFYHPLCSKVTILYPQLSVVQTLVHKNTAMQTG